MDALKERRVRPGSMPLMPGFGGSLTYGVLLVHWGDRVKPLGHSTRDFPPNDRSALDIVNAVRANQDPGGRSAAGLAAPVFAEARTA